MILELKHPTRGDIGTVTLKDGVVVKTQRADPWMSNPSPLRQMKGWIEASVREYAKSQNWICTTRETEVVQPTQGQVMSNGEDFNSRR